MNILYYTSGVSGSGRLVTGIALGNALKRKHVQCTYTLLSSSPFGHIVKDFTHIYVRPETAEELFGEKAETQPVYREINRLKPDILVVDLLWFPIHRFIRELPCKKVFLSRQVDHKFFTVDTKEETLTFDPDDYDVVLATEPFESCITEKHMNPIVIRNRQELLSRGEALAALQLDPGKKHCLFSVNASEDQLKDFKNMYSTFEEEGYGMIYSSLFNGGIFPVMDYFNAFDYIISGAGYNAFWEIVYAEKEALFIPFKTLYENQKWRMDNCRDYQFTENGADELAGILVDL